MVLIMFPELKNVNQLNYNRDEVGQFLPMHEVLLSSLSYDCKTAGR